MSDYSYEPKEKPSSYLRLKKKGDTVTIRLAGAPQRKPVIWKEGQRAPMEEDYVTRLTPEQWLAIYREPDFTVSETFLWEVIDRADGLAKVFPATSGVYKSIKEFAEMPEWGDPTTYDIKVERTEEPGRNYYKVTAIPNKEPLTQGDMARLDELKFAEKEPLARKLSDKQIDYIPDETEDTAEQESIAASTVAAADASQTLRLSQRNLRRRIRLHLCRTTRTRQLT
jgi:hypothetical protein